MQNKEENNVRVEIVKQGKGKLIKLFITDEIKVNDCVKAKHKNESGKIIKKITAGWRPSGDLNLPEGVNVEMVADKENDRYIHRVFNKKTGELLHKEEMRLSEHK